MKKYTIKFSKTGMIKFIGHLDLLRLFQRSIKMANLPIVYSKGFNPHQQTSFALPLSLGMSSIGEYVDIQLENEIELNIIKDKLNNVFPEGIKILEVTEKQKNEKNGAAILDAAIYEIDCCDKIENLKDILKEISKLDNMMIIKAGKKKTQNIDIKDDIYNIEDISDENSSKIKVTISAGSKKNLKPELLVQFIYNYIDKEYIYYKLKYKRIDLLKMVDDKLVSLNYNGGTNFETSCY